MKLYQCCSTVRVLHTLKRPLCGLLAVATLLLITACTLQYPIALADSACKPSRQQASAIPVLAPGNTSEDIGEATQWKLHQLELNASEVYTNPYTDITVTATFHGPDGKQLSVQGFWNGDHKFVVRFTPTSPGNWSYSITSEPADAGLTQTGAFVVNAATTAETGFVRRDPAYPYSFVYDNGKHYFMMGNTYYDLIRTACASEAWREGVVKSRQHGINKIRIFVHSLGFGPDHLHPDYYPPVYPFVNDDHDQISVDYWEKMDVVVSYLAEQGMVADLILFMKPYNTDDELAFGTQAQDERYVRYILARYAAFPNVIWCITNEWEYTGRDEAYWERIGEIVRNEDPWMAEGDAYRPLSIHNATNGKRGGKFAYFDNAWPVHAIVQYGVRNGQFQNGDEWANYSIVQNRGNDMPVVNDEYGYIGELQPVAFSREQHRRALWAITVGGGYGSTGDFRIFKDGPNRQYARVIMTGHWHDAAEYQDIKRLVDFWTTQGIPYWHMEPQNERIEDGDNIYVLGHDLPSNERGEFVIYAAVGGDFTVILPDGVYAVNRFDPRTGETLPLSEVIGGKPLRLQLPESRDWVLHLKDKPLKSQP